MCTRFVSVASREASLPRSLCRSNDALQQSDHFNTFQHADKELALMPRLLLADKNMFDLSSALNTLTESCE